MTGDGDRSAGDRLLWTDGGSDVLLSLPESARDAFKDPFGPVYADVATLLEHHEGPIVAVGDIVTYHFEEGDHCPWIAYVDGRTERETTPEPVRETLETRENRIEVDNPPGTITAELLEATASALDVEGPTTIVVDGEEDLAAVPAVLAAPDGATVVYGQPGEGMVAVDVTGNARASFQELLAVFDGDVERALELLED